MRFQLELWICCFGCAEELRKLKIVIIKIQVMMNYSEKEHTLGKY